MMKTSGYIAGALPLPRGMISPTTDGALFALTAYLLYVRHVRFQRVRDVEAAFLASRKDAAAPPGAGTGKQARMTPAEAQKIMLPVYCLEMPFLAQKASLLCEAAVVERAYRGVVWTGDGVCAVQGMKG